ncbi:four helix bundle protein [Algibacter pectinivorans]|uniref:Four helix bundle protein n=1 Tax=Algibacter pectinivorans TaxID=870482 RepID=A0A1I1RKV4_9FLAO|nr:four helix bundle protein [Algibacter pectinivorans]SFD31030.1 four helix bundle protein [Algibacter pectinivorans]
MVSTSKKPYSLEERTYDFARDCRFLVRDLKKTISNVEDGKQLVRSSGSVGANYIEGNEKLGDKDLKFRMKISRKEAKESEYWLKLLKELNEKEEEKIKVLIIEANEIRKILSAIINKL